MIAAPRPVEHGGRIWLHVATPPRRRKRRDYVIAAAFVAGVHPEDVTGRSRLHAITYPRMAAMVVARNDGMTLDAIARTFSRGHTTALLACRKADALAPYVRDVERALMRLDEERGRKASA